MCADHTGEFADIAVGDPWYRPHLDDEPGRSLVLARSEPNIDDGRGLSLFVADKGPTLRVRRLEELESCRAVHPPQAYAVHALLPVRLSPTASWSRLGSLPVSWVWSEGSGPTTYSSSSSGTRSGNQQRGVLNRLAGVSETSPPPSGGGDG